MFAERSIVRKREQIWLLRIQCTHCIEFLNVVRGDKIKPRNEIRHTHTTKVNWRQKISWANFFTGINKNTYTFIFMLDIVYLFIAHLFEILLKKKRKK